MNNNTTTRHHNITLQSEVHVFGQPTRPALTDKERMKHLTYMVEFWGIEPGCKECQFGTGFTDSLDLANSWAEQIRLGLLPEGTNLRILHQCR